MDFMKVYLTNGMVKEETRHENLKPEFYILEFDNKYMYPNDSISYDVDNELVRLYDTLRDLFFESTDEYYKELDFLPIFVQAAGQDSDCTVTKDLFVKLIHDKTILELPNINKHLYLVDCQYLIGTIQNLLQGMEYAFLNFYIYLADSTDIMPRFNDGNVYLEMSANATRVVSLIETYFTKAYSILDMFCKIAHEMEHRMEDFSEYKKMKSSNVLWGDRKKLKINNTSKTVFEKCELISLIEAIRNEVVHNGSWELRPKIFNVFEDERLIERYVLFPDMEDGHLSTAKNRRHFFGKGTKVNNIFPKIHYELMSRVLDTVNVLNSFCFEYKENKIS